MSPAPPDTSDDQPSSNQSDAEVTMAATLSRVWEAGRETTMVRLDTIETTVADLLLGDEANLADAIGAAHKLAGTLGMFGLPGGSALARELELLLEGDTLSPDDLVQASELTSQLRTSIESHDEPGQSGVNDPNTPGGAGDAPNGEGDASRSGSTRGSSNQPSLILVGRDRSYLEAMALGAGQHQLSVERWPVEQLESEVITGEEPPPSGSTLVVDLASLLNLEQVPDLTRAPWNQSFWAAIGTPDDLDSRLQVARHAFDLVLSNKVKAEQAIDIIAGSNQVKNQPISVLVIGHGEEMTKALSEQLPQWSITSCRPEELADHEFSQFWFMVVDVASLVETVLSPVVLCRALAQDHKAMGTSLVVAVDPSDEIGNEIMTSLAATSASVTANDPESLGRRLSSLVRRQTAGEGGDSHPGSGPTQSSQLILDQVESDLLPTGGDGSDPGQAGELTLLAVTPLWNDPDPSRWGTDDALWSSLTRVLGRNFRSGDMKGQWGDAMIVTATLDRSQMMGRMQSVTNELGNAGITVELGVSSPDPSGDSAQALIERALTDRASLNRPRTQGRGERGVLVVDDDELIASMLVDLLGAQGHQVDHLANGVAAVEVLTRPERVSDYRLVLLDISLPGIDGFGVLRQMTQAGTIGQVPVIMLTARASEDEMVLGLDLGAVDYVTKPFSPLVLLRRVNQAMTQPIS